MESKGNVVKLLVCVLAVLAAVAFFAPWVSVYSEEVVHTTTYSPIALALGVGFPYYNAYPLVFAFVLIPLVIAALGFTKLPYGIKMLAAMGGLLAVTAFNMYFAFGMAYRPYASATPVFWLVVAVYVAMAALLFYAARASKEIVIIENVDPPYNKVQKLVTAAVLLSMAVVVAFFAITIPVGGTPALRISFAGLFNNTTAILFGPVFGGIQRALQDMLSHFMRPMGAFLWPITVVAFMRGFATGWVWLKVRNVRPKVYSVMYTAIFSVILAFGLFNLFAQFVFPDSAYVMALTPRQGEGLFFATAYYISSWGLIAAGIIGLVPQFAVYKLTRKTGNSLFYGRFIKFLVAILLPGLFFNSVNSVIIFLTAVSPAAFTRGFVYFWAPRFFEELITSMIMVYAMVVLVEVYEVAMKRKVVQRSE
ncbi:MAG: ECF transporter S component [Defluviitaleaceae bacterium]|nr:ECF transporter S component [Defluviitaleaceae bacterium]